jgi:hypothetical protein
MPAQKTSALAKERFERAAAAMRENLKRRKQQQQARDSRVQETTATNEKE